MHDWTQIPHQIIDKCHTIKMFQRDHIHAPTGYPETSPEAFSRRKCFKEKNVEVKVWMRNHTSCENP